MLQVYSNGTIGDVNNYGILATDEMIFISNSGNMTGTMKITTECTLERWEI